MALPSDFLIDLGQTLAGLLGPGERRQQVRAELRLLPRLLAGALPQILRAKVARHATLAHYVSEHARKRGAAAAIASAEEQLSFAELDARVSGVARTLGQYGLPPTAPIALLGQPSPTYLALILGAARAGVAVSLISPALRGELLRRALCSVEPALVVVESEFEPELVDIGIRSASYGAGSDFERRITDNQVRRFEPAKVPASADYVHIFTSGTTGFPKACRVTHQRALLAAAVFSELIFAFEPGDRLYAPLPLHHSSALLLGAGSCIMAGVPIILRRRFSASEFWNDVVRFDASAMLYIGELCRALLAQPESRLERDHRLRVAVGNGLSPELWSRFGQRFRIGQIREFYGATDVPSAIVNLTGRPGSVGHVPLRRTRGLRLLRVNRETLEVARDTMGRAAECAVDEPGELVIRVRPRAAAPLGEVPVYTDLGASQSRLLKDLFESGDCFYRTGDILSFDRFGYFRFVERAGDSFRYKGENVSCALVEAVLREAPGVADAAVVGVTVPGIDGSPPLAVIVPRPGFSLEGLWSSVQTLPDFARPCFVRLSEQLPYGETFKVQRQKLAAEGVDPEAPGSAVYVRTGQAHSQLTPQIWAAIKAGTRRL